MNETVLMAIDVAAFQHFEGCGTTYEAGAANYFEALCLQALRGSGYQPTTVRLPIECVRFSAQWLEAGLKLCERLVEEEGLMAEVAAARPTYTRPQERPEGGSASLIDEYLAVEALLTYVRELLREHPEVNALHESHKIGQKLTA